MTGVSHRGADPLPAEPHGAADPNRNAFRSFWTAPAGPERPPQAGMYDYDPNYQQQRSTHATHAPHNDHHTDDGHSHSHGGAGHAHSHGGGDGGGHAHRLDESAPLLGGGGSSASSSAGRRGEKVLGVFASYTQLLCCLIPLLIALALLSWFLFFRTTPPPASAPVIIPPPPPASSTQQPVAAVCNPFALTSQSVDIAGKHGLVAYLYMLPAGGAEGGEAPTSTAGYRRRAEAVNTTYFFSALDTPTRIFTRSFAARNETSGQQQLMPSQYFLLSFHTILLPPAQHSGSGAIAYQLALISDDGSVLYGADEPESAWVGPRRAEVLIDNDGVHTTRIAFSEMEPVNSRAIIAGRASNLTLHYFQGPPAHIALQLLYRPINFTTLPTSSNSSNHTTIVNSTTQHNTNFTTTINTAHNTEADQQHADSQLEGSNDLYWHVQAEEGAPSQPTERYSRLLERGWRVVPAEWYWLPEWYEGKAAVEEKVAAGVDPCL